MIHIKKLYNEDFLDIKNSISYNSSNNSNKNTIEIDSLYIISSDNLRKSNLEKGK